MAKSATQKQVELLQKKALAKKTIASNKARFAEAREALKVLQEQGKEVKLEGEYKNKDGNCYSIRNQELLALQGAKPGVYRGYRHAKSEAKKNGWELDYSKVYSILGGGTYEKEFEDGHKEERLGFKPILLINVEDIYGYNYEVMDDWQRIIDENEMPIDLPF